MIYYLLRIPLSVFINVFLTFLICFLIIFLFINPQNYWNGSKFGLSVLLAFPTSAVFGFFNGLAIGLIPYKYVQNFLSVIGFGLLQSTLVTILLSIALLMFPGNKPFPSSFGAFIIFAFVSVICFVSNLISLLLLNKFLPDKDLIALNTKI